MKFILDIVKPYISATNFSELSLACISTSNPVYLVFELDQCKPSLIIRSAGSTDVVKAHKVTEDLYGYVPELIPEPIAIVNTEQGEYAIQRGVTGLPWFQISNEYKTLEQWHTLRERALNALEQLHAAIEQQTAAKPLDVLVYAEQCLSEAVSSGLSLNTAQIEGIRSKFESLKSLAPIATYPQHGDYCLNNLIIEQSQIHIIDFEDYGMTCLPLFDHFSLALSLSSSAPVNLELTLEQTIKVCTDHMLERYRLTEEHLNALFIVHLLIRLGEWSSGERREVFREFLEKILEQQFLSN